MSEIDFICYLLRRDEAKSSSSSSDVVLHLKQYSTGHVHPSASQPAIRMQNVTHHGVVVEVTGPFVVLLIPGADILYVVNWHSGDILIVRILSI